MVEKIEKRGGPRLAVRNDDKRIIRKLNDPVRVTITLERPQLEWLQSQGVVSEVIRELIKDNGQRMLLAQDNNLMPPSAG